jgi:hypothetical protein
MDCKIRANWPTGLSQINVRQLSFLSICLFHREDRKERKEKNPNFALLARFAVQNLDFENALNWPKAFLAHAKIWMYA